MNTSGPFFFFFFNPIPGRGTQHLGNINRSQKEALAGVLGDPGPGLDRGLIRSQVLQIRVSVTESSLMD